MCDLPVTHVAVVDGAVVLLLGLHGAGRGDSGHADLAVLLDLALLGLGHVGVNGGQLSLDLLDVCEL